jgi:hypothetical protein
MKAQSIGVLLALGALTTWQQAATTTAAYVAPSPGPADSDLYEVLARELADTRRPFICFAEVQPGQAHASDPRGEAVTRLRARNAAFRFGSECSVEQDGILDTATGARGGVLVTVWRATQERPGSVLRVVVYDGSRFTALACGACVLGLEAGRSTACTDLA